MWKRLKTKSPTHVPCCRNAQIIQTMMLCHKPIEGPVTRKESSRGFADPWLRRHLIISSSLRKQQCALLSVTPLLNAASFEINPVSLGVENKVLKSEW